MGCDIHVHVEIKIMGQWHHYNEPNVDRNYDLFTKIAGVRCRLEDQIEPIAQPRGLPKDISIVTRFEAEIDDGHSHTWLSAKEAKEIQEWHQLGKQFVPPLFGYLFGNYIDDEVDSDIKKMGYEDSRVICWFDS